MNARLISYILVFSFVFGFAGALVAVYAAPPFITAFLGEVEVISPQQDTEVMRDDGGVDEPAYRAQTSQENQIIAIVKQASPSVVSVVAKKDVPVISSPFFRDPFFRQFFDIPQQQETQRQQVSAGTGFVVSEDGLVITNKHVVADTEADYSIITTDGTTHEAVVLARDPFEDIAILQVENLTLPVLSLGNSDSLQQGQTVIAIGNALGELNNTISVGVVSGLRRTIIAGGNGGLTEQLQELIQTDAAINPGNSGGPLLNLAGQVIGINVARASNAENIGFAIPINRAKSYVQGVKEQEKISHTFLGERE